MKTLTLVLLVGGCACTAVVLAQLLHVRPVLPRRYTPAQVAELLIAELEAIRV